MTKTELISAVAKECNMSFSKKEIKTILEASLKVIADTLVKGDNVQFIGFGTFDTRTRASRMGWDPSTDTKIRIPAKRVPVFRAGSCLKKSITDFDNKPKRGRKKK